MCDRKKTPLDLQLSRSLESYSTNMTVSSKVTSIEGEKRKSQREKPNIIENNRRGCISREQNWSQINEQSHKPEGKLKDLFNDISVFLQTRSFSFFSFS